MPIPPQDNLAAALLSLIGDEKEHRIRDLFDPLARHFDLTEDDLRETIKSGESRFKKSTQWAAFALRQAMFAEAAGRGSVKITDMGKKILQENHKGLDLKIRQNLIYSENRDSADKSEETLSLENRKENALPDDRVEEALAEINDALKQDIISAVRSLGTTPQEKGAAFERLVLNLLEKMGYGSPHHLGRSHDGGVDGVMYRDAFGLDRIYMQAKCFDETRVGKTPIESFIAALDRKNESKGIFITSSNFENPARKTAENANKRIILIDGDKLAELMIKHDIGVRKKSCIIIKEIDEQWFEDI